MGLTGSSCRFINFPVDYGCCFMEHESHAIIFNLKNVEIEASNSLIWLRFFKKLDKGSSNRYQIIRMILFHRELKLLI